MQRLLTFLKFPIFLSLFLLLNLFLLSIQYSFSGEKKKRKSIKWLACFKLVRACLLLQRLGIIFKKCFLLHFLTYVVGFEVLTAAVKKSSIF
jgi:hypothetical protein